MDAYSQGIVAEKRALRTRMKAAVCPDVAESDRKLRQRLFAHPAYQAARDLFCYVSFGDEADTHTILEEALGRGVRVSVPLVCQGIMSARRIQSLADLHLGAMGFLQPSACAPEVEPSVFDLIIVPGLAFDRAGQRLGRGGGYYDRYLAGTDAPTLALCREARLLYRIPTLRHDQRLRYILTENEEIHMPVPTHRTMA